MPQELLFSSKDFKKLLQVSDCELMHMRESGELNFVKKGNAFLYKLHDKYLLLKHPLANQLFNWYQGKHAISLNNIPKESESIESTIMMIETVLLPICKGLGNVTITYGFVSSELNKYIQKNSSSGTYPSIDQHAASELNNLNNHICKRHGLACDIIVSGYEERMEEVVLFIVKNLSFDKVYFYGKNRPLHVSVGNEPERHLQIMNVSDKGRRIPGRKAFGNKAIILAEELNR